MRPLATIDRDHEPRLRWAFPPWFLPIWTAALAWQWWRVAVDELRSLHPAAASDRLAAAGLAGVAGRLLGFALEAGWYAAIWAAVGRRLPFRRFASWVVSLSMIEVVAASLRHSLALRHGGGIGWAILLGPVAWRDAGAAARDGMAAFGTLGLMTLVRIAGTARAQQLALGVRPWAPLLLTTLTWTLTRAGFWALTDLARGRSPAP